MKPSDESSEYLDEEPTDESDEEIFGLPERYVEMCTVGNGGYGLVL
jgi:hypothetical protein